MVNILLSTYNGESFLEEQLNSIFLQDYLDFRLYVRDDGSTDKTVNILKEYKKKLNNPEKMVIWEGKNIGVTNSFLKLLNESEESDYYSFCDQDDVWFSNKISVAIQKIQEDETKFNYSIPLLYCCRPKLTDENLISINDKIRKDIPIPSFGNALIENICTGCTIVINRNLYNIVKNRQLHSYLLHDMWLYQVASCFGKVIYDNNPHIYYRQHAGNLIGLDSKRVSVLKRQIKLFRKLRGKYSEQIEEFEKIYELKGKNKYLAELIVGTKYSWKYRFKILFDKNIVRQNKFDSLLFKILLFFGLL